MSKTIFRTALTETSTEDKEGAGVLRWELDKCYRWVKYVGSDALTQGDVLCHDLSVATDAAFQAAIKPATVDLSALAGVVVATSVPAGNTTAQYLWLQTLGYNATVAVTGQTTGGADIAIGDYLKPANASFRLARDAATQALYRRTVQALEVLATTTTPLTTSTMKGYIFAL